MKKIFVFILLTLLAGVVYSQSNDSLVLFSTLKYQTEIERKVVTNFVKNQSDTLRFFLSIDQSVTQEEIISFENVFNRFILDLKTNTSNTKDIKKKIKSIYKLTHDKYLKKYNDNVFLPDLFRTGEYNCVTASMLYAMIFDRLQIPYKVMASSNHVYLIANPGTKSIVIETTNPGFENMIFSGEFKQQYVDYLKNSKLLSDTEYKSKSVEEIFQEKFKEVKEAKFQNLPGFQYYNRGISELEKNNYGAGADLLQKSYFFYPDYQVRSLLHSTLLYQIEKSNFDKVSDIDYIGQYARFDEADMSLTLSMFGNVINNMLQYNNKELYCDSLYRRMSIYLPNQKMKNEIDFSYNLIMAFRYQNKEKGYNFALNALQLKPNHNDANVLYLRQLETRLDNISNSKILLDSINSIKNKYSFEQVAEYLDDCQIITYLHLAKEAFDKNKIQDGEKYIQLFEKNYKSSVDNQRIKYEIEKTYYSYSNVYYRKKNISTQKSILNRGLNFVPNSYLLKTGL